MQRQKVTIGVRLIEAGDYLFASDLLEAWNNFLRLLSEVDLALSVQSTRTIDWSVSQLSRSSPAMLTLEPVVIDEQLDNRETVIRTAMSGMAALKERDERPKYFSDQALTNARGLVSLLGPRVRTVEVFTPEDRVICTEAIASNIREILRPGREMMGSTEGVLEAMIHMVSFSSRCMNLCLQLALVVSLIRMPSQGSRLVLSNSMSNVFEFQVYCERTDMARSVRLGYDK